MPFFLRGGTVLATGRGERLRRLRPPAPYWVVLAAPGFGVSTADAYRWWDLDAPDVAAGGRGTGRGAAGVGAATSGGWATTWRRRSRGGMRKIGALAARLRAAGALRAAMTGSGSVVFGLFASRARAREARRDAARARTPRPAGCC